ncbi:MAG: TOBE domain-containing protein [Candidatus Nanopelagicales bacterium]|jgi:molybdopterin-binding protein
MKIPRYFRKYGVTWLFVTHLRISEAAELLGVSDDTVRRWIDSGRLTASDEPGPTTVPGREVAELMREAARELPHLSVSARNRFPGIVTRVEKDGVMALVEIQAGPHRVISLMSKEAAEDLGLEPGVRAAASIKATNVVVDVS